MKTKHKTIIIVVAVAILVVIVYLYKTRKGSYSKVAHVTNVDSLRKDFVLDNPNGDGSDPTGGYVDYSYPMDRNSSGKIVPNVNGDITWQNIGNNTRLKSVIQDYGGGLRLNLETTTDTSKPIGSTRIMSRKAFRGGVFIFDVEHAPYGCGVWPALWLNGFIGVQDQYHLAPGMDGYDESIAKLAKTTTNLCSSAADVIAPKTNPFKSKNSIRMPDPHLSKYLGKDIWPASWPTGGELDILEQVNFSDTNLFSIHSGPNCEVSPIYDMDWRFKETRPQAYIDANVYSCCGATYGPLGPYSGCSDKAHQYGKGGAIATLPNGKTRPRCLDSSATSAGNCQVVGPSGSFGKNLNDTGGGVYSVQWVPEKTMFLWFFPRKYFSKKLLSKDGGPLSDNPDPEKWDYTMIPDVGNNQTPVKTLVASYNLNTPNALTKGCDINYQNIIINTTLGGGWGGGAMPAYCSVDGSVGGGDTADEYIKKCYNASAESANKNPDGAYDPKTGCYDGARAEGYRGIDSKAVFYKEAYFKIREIKVFQNSKTDDSVF